MGKYATIDQYELRPNDDEAIIPLWSSGTAPSPIYAWPICLQFWHTEYKDIKVSLNSLSDKYLSFIIEFYTSTSM